ncbi:MAG: hypothetical protein JXR37_10885 [Kiritimatiellae bacterium]|nr:hypothetical protein [Kiritimatiellia bacterium]
MNSIPKQVLIALASGLLAAPSLFGQGAPPGRALTPDEVSATHPALSPDGERVLYRVEKGRGKAQLAILDLASGQSTTLPFMERRMAASAWMGNGHIVRVEAFAGERHIFLTDTAGQAVPLGGQRDAVGEYPAASPDGQCLAYAAQRETRIVDVTGSVKARVPAEPELLVPIGWHPDGRLALASGRGDTYIVAAEGGKASLLVKKQGEVYGYFIGGRFSPDGRSLALLSDDMQQGSAFTASVWLSSAQGENPRQLLPETWSPRWVGNDRLAVVCRERDLERLALLSLEGKIVDRLAPCDAFDYCPATRTLVYAVRLDTNGDGLVSKKDVSRLYLLRL